ncbi:MAG: hypothetical protein JWM46_320 [Candidatus Kaiserbacteria bacterium]|nr:hypothetical protein [Candidatus Kaiserbacteria bacterium]
MNRVIQYLIALLIIVGAAYVLLTYGIPKQSADNTIATTTTATTTQMNVTHVQEDTASYSIDATYPQFGIPSVDTEIKKTVDAGLAEFRSYPPNPPDSSTPKNSYIGKYDNVYQGSDVVSVSLIASEDTGGAHPNTSITVVNVDPHTGHVLTLDDALSLIGKTLQRVASSSESQIKAGIGADSIFEDGFAAKAENYRVFRVNKDSVTFVFNDYQVAPYSAGPQEAVFARIK